MNTEKSAAAYEEARRLIPGGVNSPVRAFKAVGGVPRFIVSGRGCRIVDVDGNTYTDYVCSWGPLILGHAPSPVVRAVRDALRRGSSFGAPTLQETELARRITEQVPSMERVRLVNSGTEAAMSAVRLARGVTGRDRIVKFEGCYHGHADGLLAAAGSGATTFGVPTSPGVPADFARNTIVLPFNQVDRLRDVCAAEGQQIAAVIVEPVAGNVGVILPKPGFLEGLREITRKHGILLIFDEVITGFRVGPGGAQALYGVSPDMTLLGKVIGGGLPIGAYGGRADIMEHVAPQGPVYQAGTLSGNPLAVAAGLATLKELARPGTYERLENLGRRLAHGIEEACREAGVPAFHARVGSMLCTFFTDAPVVDYATALRSDTKRYAAVHRGLLERGVYFAPSQFEAAFVSTAHTRPILDETLNAFAEALRSC